MRIIFLALIPTIACAADLPSYPVVMPTPVAVTLPSSPNPQIPVVWAPAGTKPPPTRLNSGGACPQNQFSGSEGFASPTPLVEVRRVLALLRPQPHERFVDFGCGDARWLIEATKIYGCKSVGIEIDPVQAQKAQQAVITAGLVDKIQIVQGDATTIDVDAQVGVAYLYPDVLTKLKPKLLKLSRFATYMHPVDGLQQQQNGDAWIWQKSAPVQQVQQTQSGYTWYGGQAYTGRVCNNPYCAMCNAIARQLGR
jgi:hypothetical protein